MARIKRVWADTDTYRRWVWEDHIKTLGAANKRWLKKGRVKYDKQETEHEVVMQLREFEKKSGYVFTHLGLCSSDVVETARDLQIKLSRSILADEMKHVIKILIDIAKSTAPVEVQGMTHLQPASKTTIGYRLAQFIVPLTECYLDLKQPYRMRGLRGAVGTGATLEMLGILEEVNAQYEPLQLACGQVPNRNDLLQTAQTLERASMQFYKMMQDVRILASLGWVGLAETGVASSSLVSKHANPIKAERACSLARMMPNHTRTIWDCGAHSMLERTLDDSAALRITCEQMFIEFSQILLDVESTLKTVAFRGGLDPTTGSSELATVEYAFSALSRHHAQEMSKKTKKPKIYDDPTVRLCTKAVDDIIKLSLISL